MIVVYLQLAAVLCNDKNFVGLLIILNIEESAIFRSCSISSAEGDCNYGFMKHYPCQQCVCKKQYVSVNGVQNEVCMLC